jgi:hypothetical protein
MKMSGIFLCFPQTTQANITQLRSLFIGIIIGYKDLCCAAAILFCNKAQRAVKICRN